MNQFVIALLIGGFFSTLVIFLQVIFEIQDEVKKPKNLTKQNEETFETSVPYCARPFRDPKNHPWIFRDSIIAGIVNYFQSELVAYKGNFHREENIELSTMLCDKTPLIEAFIRQTKRGKFDEELFNKICDFKFMEYHAEKTFLLTSVFKEAHNSLIDDLFAGKLKC